MPLPLGSVQVLFLKISCVRFLRCVATLRVNRTCNIHKQTRMCIHILYYVIELSKWCVRVRVRVRVRCVCLCLRVLASVAGIDGKFGGPDLIRNHPMNI